MFLSDTRLRNIVSVTLNLAFFSLSFLCVQGFYILFLIYVSQLEKIIFMCTLCSFTPMLLHINGLLVVCNHDFPLFWYVATKHYSNVLTRLIWFSLPAAVAELLDNAVDEVRLFF